MSGEAIVSGLKERGGARIERECGKEGKYRGIKDSWEDMKGEGRERRQLCPEGQE